MSASLTTADGTTLYTSQDDSGDRTWVRVHVLGVGHVGSAYWSPRLLQWRHAGQGYADLHSLMRAIYVQKVAK